MKLYQEILRKSKPIDDKFIKLDKTSIDKTKILFHVPKFHPRSKEISSYFYSNLKLEDLLKQSVYNLTKNHIFIIDKNVGKQFFVKEFIKKHCIKPIILESSESKVKTISYLNKLINKHSFEKMEKFTLTLIGGGLFYNVGAYIAERCDANLIYFPTTVLSMADSPGGKVRVNLVSKYRAYKHYYKSFYEPNAMYLDERFLDLLDEKQKNIGLVEVVKHALFQSPTLYNYLLQAGNKLFADIFELKKVVLWAASLKRVCLEVDVEENENGSRKILRAGHDFSDRIEEDQKLEIPHGIAVSIGIVQQLEAEHEKDTLDKAKMVFDKFNIPYTLEAYQKWK
jgi:3-dehydroquinate synthetase